MIKLKEGQFVDGAYYKAEETVSSSDLQERFLVASGKAEYVEEAQIELPNIKQVTKQVKE